MINLLWTGGWDSTFRLLQLAIVQEKDVQPYYIMDGDRKSMNREIDAMEKIRKGLREAFSAVSLRLKPTIFIYKGSIPDDENIKRLHQMISSRVHIGAQYYWLSCFAEANCTLELELSFENVEYRKREWFMLLDKFTAGTGHERRLTGSYPEELGMFRHFRFPLLDFYKTDMETIADEYGFLGLLKLSWFCHNPLNDSPCGNCIPCREVMKNRHRHNYVMPNLVARVGIKTLRYLEFLIYQSMKRSSRNSTGREA